MLWRTRCNFCYLDDLKHTADRAHGTLVIQPRSMEYAPKGVDIFIQYSKDEKPTWTAWLMMVPEDCCCE